MIRKEGKVIIEKVGLKTGSQFLNKYKAIFWVKGKPIATDSHEQERLDGRIKVIVQVLREMGYDASEDSWSEILTKIGGTDSYWKFLDKFRTICAKQGI